VAWEIANALTENFETAKWVLLCISGLFFLIRAQQLYKNRGLKERYKRPGKAAVTVGVLMLVILALLYGATTLSA